MDNKDSLPSINVLTFWGTLCKLSTDNDFNGFKSLLDTNFSSIGSDKYAKAIFIAGEQYDFLHYLIIERGVKRSEVEDDVINSVSDKLFTIQELMQEIKINDTKKIKKKI